MKITIDNRDLEHVHIDTYQMLTGESAEEYERENMREDGREDWDTVDIEYNHDAIVKALAHESITIVTQETAHDKIIEKIDYISHGSPKYYNYTTDWYIADYEVDIVALHKYITSNYDEVLKKAQSYDAVINYGNGHITGMSKEILAHAGLCHYIDNAITADDYNMAIWEKESECYYENQVVNAMV